MKFFDPLDDFYKMAQKYQNYIRPLGENILSLPFERENEFDILEIVNTMKSHRNELKNSKLIKET